MLERFCFVYFHVHLGRVITRTLLVLRCICTYPESRRLTHQIFQSKFSELTFPLFTDKLTIVSTSINTGIISWYIVLYLYLIKRLRHEVCNVFLFVKKTLAPPAMIFHIWLAEDRFRRNRSIVPGRIPPSVIPWPHSSESPATRVPCIGVDPARDPPVFTPRRTGWGSPCAGTVRARAPPGARRRQLGRWTSQGGGRPGNKIKC